MQKVAVVIPTYKNSLNAFELLALQQCKKILSAYPVIVVKPKSLVLQAEFALLDHQTLAFEDAYFKDIKGYNRLMLSADFYKSFLDYEYILIYQLDAFVFKDELASWCRKRIDYIGAPWIRKIGYTDIVKAVKSKLQYYFHTRFNLQKNGLPSDKQFENKVGNGGFSLRRVKKFYELSKSLRPKIDQYLNHIEHQFNEDMFWSVEVNRKRKILNIPNYKVGLKFAFEFAPERAFALNNNQLPFGCHAWDKNLDFWRPIFEQCGYQI